MKRMYSFFLILFLAFHGSNAQTIPITPSIVTFYPDSTSFSCAAVNIPDSLELDFDSDSIIDLRLKVFLTLDSCPQNMNPYLRRELTFETWDSTYLLSNRNMVINEYIPEEFFPAQIITPTNFFDAELGFVYQDFFRQTSPTSCVPITEGHFGPWAPYTYHFLAKKKQSGIDYYYLFGIQFDQNLSCIRLRPPVLSNISEKGSQVNVSVILTNGRLTIRSKAQSKLQVEIIDLNGRILDEFSMNSGNGYRDFNAFKPGVYLVRLLDDKGSVSAFKVLHQ